MWQVSSTGAVGGISGNVDLDAYALTEDPDGSLWIGTSGGLAHFLTPQTNAAVAPQAPVFSQVAFGGTTIANGEAVPWSADPLTISIASLSFRDARHTRVRYRLVGLDGLEILLHS